MGIKRIEKIRNEDIRATASVANISEKIREVRLIKAEEDSVKKAWKTEVG